MKFTFFKCKHPAAYLAVQKNETVEKIDDDFKKVTYHLTCIKCREQVTINYAIACFDSHRK